MISYWKLLKVNLINQFRKDTMYYSENWTNLLSTVLFTLVQIGLIEFLFGNISTIAGFVKNDVYFLLLVGQVAFYVQSRFTFIPAVEFGDDVNLGRLDFVLTRPVPKIWHVFTKSISVVQMLRDSLPPMIPILVLIDWTALNVPPSLALAGIIVFLSGIIIDHLLIYALAMSSFWTGSSKFILDYFWAERSETKMPFEALPGWFKPMIFVLFPVFIISSLSVSVMLGYSDPGFWISASVIGCIVTISVWRILWRKALQQYSSASS